MTKTFDHRGSKTSSYSRLGSTTNDDRKDSVSFDTSSVQRSQLSAIVANHHKGTPCFLARTHLPYPASSLPLSRNAVT